jgi:putative oxidoreductase
MRRAAVLTLVRLAAGAVFVVFGLGKFVNHSSELASFRSYGLPLPELSVVLVGLLEVVGGALVVVRRLIVPASLLLAIDMVVAIIVSGIARGELVSLAVAPAELAAMVVLLLDARRA